MDKDNGVQNFEVESVYSGNAGDMVGMGANLMQMKSAYSTAVSVIKARNLDIVINRCMQEAAIAGDEFYYAWKQGGEFIEGPTVGAALAIARNWGDCAVDCKIEETATSYIFHGAFIDLQTGFNLVRPFRQNKQSPKKRDGKDIYTGERAQDIIFQIGASKAIRNVVLNGVPKWLVSKVMAKAKEGVSAIIEKMGVEKAKTMLIKKAENLKIGIDRLESVYGKSGSWDIPKLVMLSGAVRSIEDGYETIDALFPMKEDDKPATQQPQQPEQKKSSPEIESASSETEEPKKEDPKPEVEKPVPPVPEFDENDPATFENPNYFVSKINSFQGDTTAWNKFRKANNLKWSVFGGAAYQLIETAINNKEKEVLSPKK